VEGIQEGIGIMKFANGVTKAGIFKQNVLCELLLETSKIVEFENLHGKFPPDFKQELFLYIEQTVARAEDDA